MVDIREQYPLWSLEETQRIAAALGFKHPAPPGGDYMVMTSDFLITLDDGTWIVRTVKEASELEKKRVLQKLEIERVYWLERGVDWGIIVAEDIPLELVENIQWLHPHFTLDGFSFDANELPSLIRYLTGEVRASADALASVARRCDDDYSLPTGSFLALARHLLATRQWQVDMTQRINPAQPLVLQQG